MSTQKNFRLSEYCTKVLEIHAKHFDQSETESLEDIIRFYVDCKLEDGSNLGRKFEKAGL